MKTPNLIYWKPIREFWGRIKDNEILTGAYSGLEWDDLPDHACAYLAEVFKAAVSANQCECPSDDAMTEDGKHCWDCEKPFKQND